MIPGLEAFDDDALASLTSKGLLRRAQSDVEKGRASLVEATEGRARVDCAGAEVTIDAEGPARARCTCPAPGVCRHRLMAVLLLRTIASDVPGIAAPPLEKSASDMLEALDEPALAAFCGKAGWARARRLAADCAETSLVEAQGGNIAVELSHGERVLFVAGQGLGGAITKTPENRRPATVAAAAILAKARAGWTPTPLEEVGGAALTPDFLAEVRAAVERAAREIATGSGLMVEDLLRDLAISARADAAPRLAGSLRALAGSAARARARALGYDTEAIIAHCAEVYAFVEALAARPGDPALTGVLRRNYRPVAPFRAWLLATEAWDAESGARGVTLALLDAENRRWLTAGEARGTGIDQSFDPALALDGPAWGSGSFASVFGRCLAFTTPRLSNDGRISNAEDVRAAVLADVPDPGALPFSFDDWAELRANVAGNYVTGLARWNALVILRPARVDAPLFDPFLQRHLWTFRDAAGRAQRLTLGLCECARLAALAALDIVAAIAAPRQRGNSFSLDLLTLLARDNAGGVQPFAVAFPRLDPWRLSDPKTPSVASVDQPARPTRFGRLIDETIYAVCARLEGVPAAARARDLPALKVQLESLGASSVSRALDAAMCDTEGLSAWLRAIWVLRRASILDQLCANESA